MTEHQKPLEDEQSLQQGNTAAEINLQPNTDFGGHKESGLNPDGQQKVLSAAEVLALKDFDEVVASAITFCQQIKVFYEKWHGVTYDESRKEQVHTSAKLLAGFYQELFNIDELRWQNFKKKFLIRKERGILGDHQKILNWIYGVIVSVHTKKSPSWSYAANSEVSAFQNHLDGLIKNLYPGKKISSPEVLADFTYERISTIVAEFLTAFVGEGQNRVSEEGRTGFDGLNTTCPIARSSGKGLAYFALTCAEYVLMNAIVEKFNTKE